MTLEEQIKEISDRWINPEFTKHTPLPRIVTSLAVEAFKKEMEESTSRNLQYAIDCQAIYQALIHVENCTFRKELPAFQL